METLSGKSDSLYDTPGWRRPHSHQGAPSRIRTRPSFFQRLASKPTGLPSLPETTAILASDIDNFEKKTNDYMYHDTILVSAINNVILKGF